MKSSHIYSKGWWSLARILILGITAGAGAGVVASVWTSQSLRNYEDELRMSQNIPQVSVSQPTPVPGTYEEALSRVRSSARLSVASILPHSTDSALPNAWLSNDDVVAYGAVVSDDGWIVADRSAIATYTRPQDMLDIWIEETRYQITDVVRDDTSSLVMLHIDAKNLVSTDFASTEDVRSGTMVFAVGTGEVVPLSVVNTDERIEHAAVSAETFLTTWKLSDALTKSMPLFNAAGDLAGFTSLGSVNALPLHHALRAVRSVVKSGEISVPAVGMYGVDLSDAMAITSSVRQDLHAGMLIIAPNNGTRAVVLDGPAAQAGIVLGDVILAVDGETITENTSFAELLTTYAVGDTMRFTVYRGGETIVVSVTTKDIDAVIY